MPEWMRRAERLPRWALLIDGTEIGVDRSGVALGRPKIGSASQRRKVGLLKEEAESSFAVYSLLRVRNHAVQSIVPFIF